MKGIKLLPFALGIILFFFIPQSSVFAQSKYVLPYPSVMPGSIFYKFNQVKEQILRYWYFGDFGQFHYNLRQSDKYLVEAKTLFDYKQYLLGNIALEKSDGYFEDIYPNFVNAKNNGKNTSEKEIMYKEAAKKHIEELKKVRNIVSSIFIWTPENESPTTLKLWESVDKSLKIRQKRL